MQNLNGTVEHVTHTHTHTHTHTYSFKLTVAGKNQKKVLLFFSPFTVMNPE